MQEERGENVSKDESEMKTWDTVRIKENVNRKRKFEHERETHYNERTHSILGFCVFVKSHLCRIFEKCQIFPMRFTVRDLQLLH